ncbi:MAG: glycosyltransferase family 61 protein [Spirulina sp.]
MNKIYSKKIDNLARKILEKLFGWIFNISYAPKGVLLDDKKSDLTFSTVKPDKKNKEVYRVYGIPNGQLFTDRSVYIAVSYKRLLVPGASWQWKDRKILPTHENPALKTGTPQPISHFKGKVLSLLTGGSGNYNYYHWLYDVLPRIYLYQLHSDLNLIDYLLAPDLSYAFQLETLKILNIEDKRIISSAKFRHIKADYLMVVDHPNPDSHNPPEWITDWLKSTFLPKLESANIIKQHIYVSRGDSAHQRRLLNEHEVVKFLKRKGFSTCVLSDLSFVEQVNLFYNAETIIGVHGAGLTNLTFSKPGTKVIELFGKNYTPKMYEKISAFNGLDYSSIVSEDVDVSQSPQTANFSVSLKELEEQLNSMGE